MLGLGAFVWLNTVMKTVMKTQKQVDIIMTWLISLASFSFTAMAAYKEWC